MMVHVSKEKPRHKTLTLEIMHQMKKNQILQIPMSRKGKKDATVTAYCPPTNTPSHSLHTALLINNNNGNIFCKAVENNIH